MCYQSHLDVSSELEDQWACVGPGKGGGAEVRVHWILDWKIVSGGEQPEVKLIEYP